MSEHIDEPALYPRTQTGSTFLPLVCKEPAGSRTHTDSCSNSNSTRFRSSLKTYLPVLRVPLRESPRELLNIYFLESIAALRTRWLHTFALFRTSKCVALPSLTSHHLLHQAHTLLWGLRARLSERRFHVLGPVLEGQLV